MAKASGKTRGKGAPPKYKPEYCELIIEHCKKGLSFNAFAADIHVHIDTIHAWVAAYPEFAEAKKIAEAKSLKFWEMIGINGVLGKINNFNSTAYIFNMKNRFRWSDRTDLKIETDVKNKDKETHDLLRSIPRKDLLKLAKSG